MIKKNYPQRVKKLAYVAHNYEADLYRQVSAESGAEARRLKWLTGFEKTALDEIDVTFAFSEVLREQLAKLKPKGRLLSTSVCFDFRR